MVDWEGPTIRFRDGVPTKIYVPAHSFGAEYTYEEESKTFEFSYGEPLKEELRGEDGGRIYIDWPVKYPETVHLFEETNHPELFSAKGSHGSWSEEGIVYVYTLNATSTLKLITFVYRRAHVLPNSFHRQSDRRVRGWRRVAHLGEHGLYRLLRGGPRL